MTEFDKINHLQQIIDKQEAEIKTLKSQIALLVGCITSCKKILDVKKMLIDGTI